MRVYFGNGKQVYPKGGREDGITYCYFNEGHVCIGRRYYQVPLREQNHRIIKMEKIILSIWRGLCERFKRDLVKYARKYHEEYPKLRGHHINSYGIFLKIMYKIERDFNFSEISGDDLSKYIKLFGDYSVHDFIQLGYLDKVRESYRLRNRIILIIKREYECLKSIILDGESIFETKRYNEVRRN
jgi:hypothetical protein